MKNLKFIGLGFGDEAKGSFIDYIADKNKYEYFVRYNGGCQAAHNVTFDNGKIFTFSQLSASMMHDNTKTILSKNFILNIVDLLNECEEFSKTTGLSIQQILNRVYIDNECVCVTPLHKIYNIIEENFISNRGSVGTGVSIAGNWSSDDKLTIKAKDLCDYEKMFNVLQAQSKMIEELLANVRNIHGKDVDSFINQFNFKEALNINKYINKIFVLYDIFPFNVLDTDKIIESNNCIFESSQGYLLDKKYGIHPNTTLIDTSTDSILNTEGNIIGLTRSYISRHGPGILPTETSDFNKYLSSNEQENGMFNGKIRYGYFDSVLIRYSARKTNVSEIYMSYGDILKNLSKIKVCVSYKYVGEVTDEFKDYFNFYENEQNIIIKDIINSGNNISDYLYKCIPIYETIVFDAQNFFSKLDIYKEYLENIIGCKITIISVGPNKDDKLEV